RSRDLTLLPCLLLPFPLYCPCPREHRDIHSFPTRRSSDLIKRNGTGFHSPFPRSVSLIAFPINNLNPCRYFPGNNYIFLQLPTKKSCLNWSFPLCTYLLLLASFTLF